MGSHGRADPRATGVRFSQRFSLGKPLRCGTSRFSAGFVQKSCHRGKYSGSNRGEGGGGEGGRGRLLTKSCFVLLNPASHYGVGDPDSERASLGHRVSAYSSLFLENGDDVVSMLGGWRSRCAPPRAGLVDIFDATCVIGAALSELRRLSPASLFGAVGVIQAPQNGSR